MLIDEAMNGDAFLGPPPVEPIHLSCRPSRQSGSMPGKRHKPEESVAKRRQVDLAVARGTRLAEAIRGVGVSEITCQRWRTAYGGRKLDRVKRPKEPEPENALPGKAVSDLTLDRLVLQEGLRGN